MMHPSFLSYDLSTFNFLALRFLKIRDHLRRFRIKYYEENITFEGSKTDARVVGNEARIDKYYDMTVKRRSWRK